jgi:hypothetical protein
VHARLGAGNSLAALEIEAIPFDAAAVLDSLGRAARRPRPTFPTLELEILSYHRPKPGAAGMTKATGPAAVWLATRDSATAMADSLRRLNRKAPEYATAFGRFRDLYQRMIERQHKSDGGRIFIPDADRRLAGRAGSAADSLRAWEDVAYAAYASVAAAELRRTGRDIVLAETDSAGTANLALAPGPWWLQARLADPDNPFAERVWRIPVTVSARRSVTVPIFEGNYTLEWRH